jgi:SAM-dependent methyltransferase
MRKETRAFVQTCAAVLPVTEPVVEIGALQIEGQEKYADLRALFAGKEFIGCDMREGPGVDRIENLHDLSFADESVGTLIMLDTMEHVKYPFKAMEQVYRVLKPGGMVIMTSVMLCPIHAYPSDYWRFTPESFNVLLEHCATVKVYADRPALFPRSVYGVGIKGPLDPALETALDARVRQEVIERYFGEEALSIITVQGNLLTLTRKKSRGKLLFALRALEKARISLRKKIKACCRSRSRHE